VALKADRRICPNCEHGTGKASGWREQAKGDVLVLVKRRFSVPIGKVFTEPDEVCGWRRRPTVRFREQLFEEADCGSNIRRV